ncbi:pre-rRNA processing [Mycoemilia scoparia]|uniref:Pre-rRNA processing n=1 Tax=Mycoemilia scoparia TaxID=417184 RepID=A0A9W8DXC8_9FUNG|nr:pre-rRNA processing [Mycoemilia scoparia]
MADVLAELRAAIAEDEYESTNLPEKDIKDAVDQYIHLLTVNFTDHSLEPNSQFIDACVPLFVSRAFEEHGELITFHVFEKLEELINASDLYDKQTYPDSMWVVLSLCVLAGEVDNKVYQKSDVSDLLPELKAVFLTGYRNGDYQTQLPALTLAYKLCQHVPQRLEIIACADQEFIQFLLDYIQYTRDMADEAYNYAATKLVIFTTKKTSDIFYSNDLNVLVDIMIRELEDLPDDQEQLRQAYLIVLLPISYCDPSSSSISSRKEK